MAHSFTIHVDFRNAFPDLYDERQGSFASDYVEANKQGFVFNGQIYQIITSPRDAYKLGRLEIMVPDGVPIEDAKRAMRDIYWMTREWTYEKLGGPRPSDTCGGVKKWAYEKLGAFLPSDIPPPRVSLEVDVGLDGDEHPKKVD